jgi:hypothetical protein
MQRMCIQGIQRLPSFSPLPNNNDLPSPTLVYLQMVVWFSPERNCSVTQDIVLQHFYAVNFWDSELKLFPSQIKTVNTKREILYQ